MRRVLALIVIALAGCGGGGGSDLSSFDSTTAIADALTKAGIVCADFAVNTADDNAAVIDIGLPTPAEVGECSSEGDQLEIDIYAKPEQVTQTVKGSQSAIVCGFATSFGISTINAAFGENWIVGGMTDDSVRYAEALGGDSSSYDCPT